MDGVSDHCSRTRTPGTLIVQSIVLQPIIFIMVLPLFLRTLPWIALLVLGLVLQWVLDPHGTGGDLTNYAMCVGASTASLVLLWLWRRTPPRHPAAGAAPKEDGEAAEPPAHRSTHDDKVEDGMAAGAAPKEDGAAAEPPAHRSTHDDKVEDGMDVEQQEMVPSVSSASSFEDHLNNAKVEDSTTEARVLNFPAP